MNICEIALNPGMNKYTDEISYTSAMCNVHYPHLLYRQMSWHHVWEQNVCLHISPFCLYIRQSFIFFMYFLLHIIARRIDKSVCCYINSAPTEVNLSHEKKKKSFFFSEVSMSFPELLQDVMGIGDLDIT